MCKFLSFLLLLLLVCGFFMSAFSSVSVSALVEGSWVPKAPMSQTRISLGAIAVDGKIYAIGGFTASGYLSINEQYDPKTNTWTTLTSMPTPRNAFTIAAYQNSIYCIGGITSDGSRGGWYDCGVNEVYDTVTDSWSTKASLPVNASNLQAHVIDGKIFVIAGSNLFMYDPITDSWLQKTSMPTITPISKISFVLTPTDDKIIVIGTFLASSPNTDYEQKVMIYDPKTDMWREGTSPPPVETVSGIVGVTTGVYAPQRVYVLGPYNSIVYDPASDTWSTAKAILTPRNSFSVAIVDDILYAIGGSAPNTGLKFLSVNEQYVPIGYSSVPVVTSGPSVPVVTSGPSDFSEPFLTYLVVAALALTVVVFYFKKKRYAT